MLRRRPCRKRRRWRGAATILQAYLELKSTSLGDFGAQAALATDRNLSEQEVVLGLRAVAEEFQAAGQSGLEPLV